MIYLDSKEAVCYLIFSFKRMRDGGDQDLMNALL